MSKKETTVSEKPKWVRNDNAYKIELNVDGVVFVFLPGETKQIPEHFVVPNDLGLRVR